MRILYATLLLSGVVLVLHIVANAYALYFHWWWFDILMHFLGGAVIGLFLLWGIEKMPMQYSERLVMYIVLCGVLIVGIGWEIFEYIFDIFGAHDYIVDTRMDLIMDVLGAWVAVLWGGNQKTTQPVV